MILAEVIRRTCEAEVHATDADRYIDTYHDTYINIYGAPSPQGEIEVEVSDTLHRDRYEDLYLDWYSTPTRTGRADPYIGHPAAQSGS